MRNLEGCDYSYHNLAISDKDGIAPFFLGKYGFTNRRSPKDLKKCMRSSLCNDKDYIKEHLTENSIDVKTQTLNTFIKENNIERIDLLKVDTEGKDNDIIRQFLENPLIYPDKIITEDYCKGCYEDEQRKIALAKKEFIVSKGYTYTSLDAYNSCYVLKCEV